MSKRYSRNLDFDLADLTQRLTTYTVDESGCWLWQGYMDKNGYGRVYDRAKQRAEWVHRASYRLHRGPIPPGLELDHTCTVTRCMNPHHLDAVTKATYADIATALRYSSGSAAAHAVEAAIAKGLVSGDEVPAVTFLSEPEREEIRELADLGLPYTVLGQMYGIDTSQVSRIRRGMTSGHKKRGVA